METRTINANEIELLTGNYVSSDGNDYYNIVLNLGTGEYVQVKNASCSAIAVDMALEYFNLSPYHLYTPDMVKLFFMGTSPELRMERIPKKYHKYFES